MTFSINSLNNKNNVDVVKNNSTKLNNPENESVKQDTFQGFNNDNMSIKSPKSDSFSSSSNTGDINAGNALSRGQSLISSSQSDIQNAQNQAGVLSKKLDDNNVTIETEKTNIQNEYGIVKDAISEIEHDTQQQNKLSNIYNQNNNEINNKTQILEEQYSDEIEQAKNAEIEQLKLEVQENEEQIAQKQEEVEAKQQEIEENNTKIKENENKMKTLDKNDPEYQKLDSENNKLNSDNNNLSGEIGELQTGESGIETLTNRNLEIQGEDGEGGLLQAATEDLAVFQTEKSNIKNEIQVLNDSNNDLKSQFDVVNQNISKNQNIVNTSQINIDTSQNNVKDVANDSENTQEEYSDKGKNLAFAGSCVKEVGGIIVQVSDVVGAVEKAKENGGGGASEKIKLVGETLEKIGETMEELGNQINNDANGKGADYSKVISGFKSSTDGIADYVKTKYLGDANKEIGT